MLKIGIIRETKVPKDCRVPLTPAICAHIVKEYPVELYVQSSDIRAYTDDEYRSEGLEICDDVYDCDILLGVKEVKMDKLIRDKTYFFFSHTIKAQAYNRDLLKTILEKNITLLDYEVLKNKKGSRVIAFGKFAGMVGAHNALLTYGRRTGDFDLVRMYDCHDYAAAVEVYNQTEFPSIKIVLTGTGRVGGGAKKVLDDMGITQVSPRAFISESYDHPVYTQLNIQDYVEHKEGEPLIKSHYYENPEDYISTFEPFTKVSDIFINGIYWDNLAPKFFTKEQMAGAAFKIKVIADVTCDIAPISSIPSTLFASTIADPIFGYDPVTGEQTAPHKEGVIDMMTIDNLPNELPRDASAAFGQQFVEFVLPELLKENSLMIEKASVTKDGDLGKHFEYLREFVNERPPKE